MTKKILAASALSALAAIVLLVEPLPASAATSLLYTFNAPGTLAESGSMGESSSPYFWLNSGGKFIMDGNLGRTPQSALPSLDPWRLLYSITNPLDTGNGYYPQNLFRLVTRSTWGDAEQEMRFKIDGVNLTNTPNRDGYSGLLFFSRYKDGNNLYYAGIRQDGSAVIKKKINGSYYTLASVQIFGFAGAYDKYARPNLITEDKWMRLKMSVENAYDGSVLIRLFLDRENDGTFVSILSARDRGTGGAPLRLAGSMGIRSDYMNVSFDNYRITAI